jgi:N-acetyl-anhydromuramyl-L-alanine amidase AmpD
MFNVRKIPFVQAKWFTPVEGDRGVWVIVMHCMEGPEKGATAENVARYFARGSEGRKASAHYCVDADSVVQSVQCRDVSYGAPGMNRHGIHLELAGYASQSPEAWLDAYSRSTLVNAALLCKQVLCPKFGIQRRWLGDEEIRRVARGEKITGFCTHADITRALGTPGGHTDPGAGFPRKHFMELVAA